MCGADCWTDHRLVVSKLNLRIQPVRRPQGKKVPKKLDVSKLKQNSKRQAFDNDLCSRLDALEHSSKDVDESWTVFRDTFHSSAMDSLRPVSRKHQDWAEHFDGVLNRPSSINDEAINRLPQVECNPLLDELPTVSETVKAIKLLLSGKAPGSDAIPAEIYKAGSPPVAEKLTELFHIMWRKEAIPQEFKDATIIHLFKRKGNPQVCDNHRGISLLSAAGKILARVLLNRLNEHFERSGLLPESQCGFRKNRGTIDMIFTARQLQKKCQEQNMSST